MTSRAKGSPKIAIVDFLTVLVVFFLIIALLESPVKPTVQTYGVIAVTSQWGSKDDVDLYVRNPQGEIVYFAAPQNGLMYLEHDTIPLTTDVSAGHRTIVQGEHERVIITGVIPGEYTINVMMYHRVSNKPCVILVQVWTLQGQDRVLLTKYVILRHQREERTVFRMTLNANGHITRVTQVQADLTGAAIAGAGPQISTGPNNGVTRRNTG